MKKVAIIGGGITGLSAAYSIKKAIEEGRDIDYVVLEKSSRLGGKIRTERTEDGFVVEGGPDCFVSTKPWVFELARKLSCYDKLIPSNEHLKGTYILVKNKLREMPDGIMIMVPTKVMPFITTDLFSWPGKIRMAMDLFIPKKKEPGDEALASFVKRRLGKEALDRIAEPLVAGIHSGDPATMSLAATFPNLLDMEQKYGSLIKGMLAAMKQRRKAASQGSKPAAQGTGPAGPFTSGSSASKPKVTFFMSFKDGMLSIIDELCRSIDMDKVLTNAEVVKVREVKDDDGSATYELYMADGKTIKADAVILASQSNDTANMVSDLDKPMADVLNDIPLVSSAIVSLAYHKKDIKKNLKGFGLIVPISEGRDIKACTWSSNKWSWRVPDDNHVLVRVFVGGAKAQHLALLPDDEMIAMVKRELKGIGGIDAEPVGKWIFRWPSGMPQYTMGHLDRVKKLDEYTAKHPGMFLAGGSYRGVGVPDCINSGTKAAETAVAYMSGVSEVAAVTNF